MKNEKHILIVEDNEGDIVLTLEALKEVKLTNKITVARDGLEALNMLKRNSPYEKFSLPDILLLDINLPKMNGKEVLSFIKSDPVLKMLPVIMLSTSSSENDIKDSYNNHANCYITKPTDFSQFTDLIKTVENFWINVVSSPKDLII